MYEKIIEFHIYRIIFGDDFIDFLHFIEPHGSLNIMNDKFGYLYNGIPALSLNHNTMLILSWDGEDNGQYNNALCPSIASMFVVGTVTKLGKKNYSGKMYSRKIQRILGWLRSN